IKCIFTDTIVNDVYSLTVRQPLRFTLKIFLGVDDALISTCITRELGLVLRPNCPNDACSDLLRHLDQQQSDTTRRSVYQRRLAALQFVTAVRKVMSRHALKHC